MTVEVMTMPEPEHVPLAEMASIERLGTLVKRYRLNAKKTIAETAACLKLSEAVIENVEKFAAPLSVDQLQELAVFLNVRFEPFLDAARDFHRGIWEQQGRESGVQLSEMTSKVGSVGENVIDLEQTAVDVVHSAARHVQSLRRLAACLPERTVIAQNLLALGNEHLGQAKRLQDVLVARGVLQEAVPGSPMSEESSEESKPQTAPQSFEDA